MAESKYRILPSLTPKDQQALTLLFDRVEHLGKTGEQLGGGYRNLQGRARFMETDERRVAIQAYTTSSEKHTLWPKQIDTLIVSDHFPLRDRSTLEWGFMDFGFTRTTVADETSPWDVTYYRAEPGQRRSKKVVERLLRRITNGDGEQNQ